MGRITDIVIQIAAVAVAAAVRLHGEIIILLPPELDIPLLFLAPEVADVGHYFAIQA